MRQRQTEQAGHGPTSRRENRLLRKWFRTPVAMLGLLGVLVFVLSAVFAPWIAPHDPIQPNFFRTWEAPSSDHLLGTDNLGRDVLARVLHGGRISLFVGITSQMLVLLIGVLLGAIAGFFGGRTDTVIMRITDVALAFPDLLLIILFMAVFGPGLGTMAVAIGLSRWPVLARLVRSSFLSYRESEMVEAARATGASGARIIFRHILPNTMPAIIVNFTFGIPTAIMAEAGLSYIGIGVNPPTPTWGLMINEGFASIRSHPHLILAPAVAIAFTMLSFVLLGNGLQDVLDVKHE